MTDKLNCSLIEDQEEDEPYISKIKLLEEVIAEKNRQI